MAKMVAALTRGIRGMDVPERFLMVQIAILTLIALVIVL
jgi:hypothetical protein